MQLAVLIPTLMRWITAMESNLSFRKFMCSFDTLLLPRTAARPPRTLLLGAMLPLVALLALGFANGARAGGQDDVAPPQPVEALGYAPAWGTAAAAGTFSIVNLQNGSLSTTLPLVVHIPGLGPVADVVLIHSSGCVGRGTLPEFPLGEGWTMELLSILDVGESHVTFGSGARVYFSGGVSSAGYFLTLSQISADRWIISNGHGELVYELVPDGSTRARLVEVHDQVGNVLTLAYATSGLLSQMMEANGRSVSFHDTDSDGRIDQIVDDSDPTIGTLTLSYTGARLTSFVDAGGSGTQLDYYTDGRIHWIDDGYQSSGSGHNRWTYTYNTSGKLATVADPSPLTSSTTLTYTGLVTSVTTRTGSQFDYEFDYLGRLVRAACPLMGNATYAYNSNNQRTTLTNSEGHAWLLEYDDRGNQTKVTDPSGNVSTLAYNADSKITSMADATGPDATFNYTDSSYPSLLTEVVLPPDGQGHPAATTKITYYSPSSGLRGLIETVTDPNGVVTKCTYDSRGILDEVTTGSGFARPVKQRKHYDTAGVIWTHDTFTPDLVSTDPTGFPTLPGGHPAMVSTPTRSAQSSFNWAAQRQSWTSTYTPGIQPVGAGSPELQGIASNQLTFDYLGRVVQCTRTDSEPTVDQMLAPIQRIASTTFHDVPATGFPHGGRVEQDSSSVTRSIVYDELGRAQTVTSSDGLTTSYEYFIDGTLKSVTLDVGTNKARYAYQYAANNRPTSMKVEFSSDGGTTWVEQRRLEWVYGTAQMLQYSFEYHFGVLVAGTGYYYDAREQLIWEKRLGLDPYNRTYAYDQGGNRTGMLILDGSDQLQEQHVYSYDVGDPAAYLSKANRLMQEQDFDASGTLLRSKWYYYDNAYGNVREVVTKDASDAWHHGVSLVYLQRPDAELQSTVALVLERKWIADGSGVPVPGTLTWTRARELRQAGVMDRYLYLERDPQTLAPLLSPDSRVWTDTSPHSADPTSDFSVSPANGSITELRTRLSALGQVDATGPLWLACDLVGNTRWWLNSTGVFHDEVATAYGERISTGTPFSSRYGGFLGVAGGEEDLLPLGWKRVGARLYDPASGRWLQRDPIGLAGGINEYEYALNCPSMLRDSSGLQAPGPTVQLQPGQVYTFSNDNWTVTVSTVPGDLIGPPPPPIDLGKFPGSTGPPGIPMPPGPGTPPAAPPAGPTPPPGWPQGLPFPPNGLPTWPPLHVPGETFIGPAPDPVPEPELSWWQRGILTYLEEAIGWRKTHPGAGQMVRLLQQIPP